MTALDPNANPETPQLAGFPQESQPSELWQTGVFLKTDPSGIDDPAQEA
ncbi:hypothetical protein CES85_0333 [Ochrobactrum quorumnocens]|uniref:Uncharacterized protein n=1 Tax=Ochrobactrum quorumnocens TaxID=271865 RepID=A0A248UEK9_9HYPH|nr:hypothetical protein CES85_0333 [[Ochrobactrum] quorumnocens]